MAKYVPARGDLVALTFDPQSGHEQRGRRPALVVSSARFSRHTGFAMACPITSTRRNFPFHVEIPAELGLSVTGFIMVEQIKSIDYASRRIKFIERAPQRVLDEVVSIVDACLHWPN